MALRSRSPGPADATPAAMAEVALESLYAEHYLSLVRIATLLLRDHAAAEDAVQDAFVAMHAAWPRLRSVDAAGPYLRQVVVNRCRSRQRHLQVVDRNQASPLPDAPSAEDSAMVRLDRRDVMHAIAGLPIRQREAVVMRYYADLSEAEIAAAMGCSRGAVKSHASRGLAALRRALEPR